MGMTSNSGNSGDGITIGGFHFPDVTNIFKHHPSRPTPHGNPSNPPPVPTTSISGYAKYLAAGGICATITHGMTTPIDVVKTRIQVDPSLKGAGLLSAGRTIVASEGPAALLTGFGPTAVGYLVQGGMKFAGYEFFKGKLISATGDYNTAVEHRTAIYLTSAAIAEFFADVALCPLEATRIRLVSERGFATGLVTGFMRIMREEGARGFYSGFIPILCKQIPFALGQFTVHEWMNELILRNMSEESKKNMTSVKHTAIELTSGVVAGIAAATLSQPADTLLSQINKGKGGEGEGMVTRLYTLGKAAGFRGLFAGLGPRMIMTAFLVSGQFAIYADIKKALGAPPSVEIHKGGDHLT